MITLLNDVVNLGECVMMIEKHVQKFRELMPDVQIKAALIGRNEATGQAGFYYFEPSKMLFVLTDDDQLIIMKFTATMYSKPKRVPYAALKKSFALKGYSINMSGADIRNNDEKMRVEGEDHDEEDAPRKRGLFRGNPNKPKKTLYDSNYRVEEYILNDAFPSIETFIDYLFKTFTKERSQSKIRKEKKSKRNMGFDF